MRWNYLDNHIKPDNIINLHLYFYKFNKIRIKMKRFRRILVIFIILTMVTTILTGLYIQNKSKIAYKSGHKLKIKGDPIIDINNNGDFTTYAEPGGNGSSINPYIITDKVINGNGSTCISISDTTAYFIISNCIIYNGSDGIYCYNVSNGEILNNTITNCGSTGIYLESDTVGSNFKIRNNTVNYNDGGLELSSIKNCQVIDNSFNHNDYAGIYYWNVNNTPTNGNELVNNSNYGFYIDNTCWNNIITENNVSKNDGDGIYITDRCNYNKLLNNIINNNAKNGIHIYDRWTNYSIFINNTINFNGDSGIYSYEGAHNWFENNTVNFNDYDGIYFGNDPDNGKNCTILNNNASYNNESGINIESENAWLNITHNIANNNSNHGIHLEFASNISITYNIANKNLINGIFIEDSDNNNITWNVVHDNTGCIIESGTGSNIIENNSCISATLTDGICGMSSGDTNTHFIFYVNYTDVENMAPFSVWVVIDNQKYEMTRSNLSDNDYTDGCIYTYTTTLSVGTPQIYFEAYEIIYKITTTEKSGPTVTTPPIPWMHLYLLLPAIGLVIAIFMIRKHRKLIIK